MLDSLKKRPGSLRWPPRQRFTVTESGRVALNEYAEAIERYHAGSLSLRDELTSLQKHWADLHKVDPTDAAILGEFATEERLPREVQASLDDCGTTLPEVQASVDRLFTAGLLAPAGGGGPLPPPNEAIV
jgi:hypothetical protein